MELQLLLSFSLLHLSNCTLFLSLREHLWLVKVEQSQFESERKGEHCETVRLTWKARRAPVQATQLSSQCSSLTVLQLLRTGPFPAGKSEYCILLLLLSGRVPTAVPDTTSNCLLPHFLSLSGIQVALQPAGSECKLEARET